MIEEAKDAGVGVWNATKDAAVARLASPILGFLAERGGL